MSPKCESNNAVQRTHWIHALPTVQCLHHTRIEIYNTIYCLVANLANRLHNNRKYDSVYDDNDNYGYNDGINDDNGSNDDNDENGSNDDNDNDDNDDNGSNDDNDNDGNADNIDDIDDNNDDNDYNDVDSLSI